MAHRALTLKYRPQVFSDLVGQDHVSSVLMRAVESGRVAQAYLFTGARGVGKTTSARILAKALNCERRAAGKLTGADPCNACTSCTEITAGVSLDVAEIDGASNRGIADVQALREKVRFAPTGGHWRVLIIDEVHQLSGDAFAALLKTLEEPPAHLVFIFATTDPQKLPDTIRSRTQRFDFARVPLRKVADRLQAIVERERKEPDGVRVTLTEGAALLIAQKSEGSMRDAVSALDQVVSAGEPAVDEALVRRVLGIADRESFFEIAGAITARDPKATLAALHRAFAKGLDPRDLAEGLAEHLRHLLVLAVDPSAAELVPVSAEELERLRQQGGGWSEHDLLRLVRLAAECQWPMRDSPQPLVHLEAAVLQMATLEPGETIAVLLQRLEALEQRLGGGAPSSAAPRAGGAPGGAAAPNRAGSAAGTARATAGPRSSFSPPPAGDAPRASAGVPAPAPQRMSAAIAPAPMAPAAPATMAPATMAPATAAAVLEADDAPVSDPTSEAQWLELVRLVNARKPLLGAFLNESRFVEGSAQLLVLAMDDLHRAVVDEKENRALIGGEVVAAFGRTLALRCVGLEGVPVRPKQTARDVDSVIDRTLQFFDAEIIQRPGRGERTST